MTTKKTKWTFADGICIGAGLTSLLVMMGVMIAGWVVA